MTVAAFELPDCSPTVESDARMMGLWLLVSTAAELHALACGEPHTAAFCILSLCVPVRWGRGGVSIWKPSKDPLCKAIEWR